jgi:hypothetical protein
MTVRIPAESRANWKLDNRQLTRPEFLVLESAWVHPTRNQPRISSLDFLALEKERLR